MRVRARSETGAPVRKWPRRKAQYAFQDSVVLRSREDQFAAVFEVAAVAADFYEAFWIQFETSFEFVIADANGVPNGKSSFAFEFHVEIYECIFAVPEGKAPHFIRL